ncbi:MAG: hypothetical protein WCU74_04580 [Candidatus Omnitrophota bacterium]
MGRNALAVAEPLVPLAIAVAERLAGLANTGRVLAGFDSVAIVRVVAADGVHVCHLAGRGIANLDAVAQIPVVGEDEPFIHALAGGGFALRALVRAVGVRFAFGNALAVITNCVGVFAGEIKVAKGSPIFTSRRTFFAGTGLSILKKRAFSETQINERQRRILGSANFIL